MEGEYGFKHKKCYCGLDLTGKRAEATSYRFGNLPQAKCPNPDCGRDMLLDAPPVEPVIVAPTAEASESTTKRRR